MRFLSQEIEDQSSVQRTKQTIVSWICNNLNAPGQRLPPQARLVKELNCSATTVCKAMQMLVEQGIVKREVGRGTFLQFMPSAGHVSAQPDLTPKTIFRTAIFIFENNILVDSDSPIFEMLRDAEQIFSKNNRISLAGIYHIKSYEEYVRIMDGLDVKGIVIDWRKFPERLSVTGVEHDLNRRGIASVHCLHEFTPSCSAKCVVSLDHGSIARMAVEHLDELGHRKIMIAGADNDYNFQTDRIMAASNLAKFLDIRYEIFIPEKNMKMPEGEDSWGHSGKLAFRKWFSEPEAERATAVFAINTKLAVGFANEAMRNGVKIPEDVSIIGVDNDFRVLLQSGINMTILDPSRTEMGEVAARWLIQRLGGGFDNQNGASVKLMKPVLLNRGSTCPPKTRIDI